MRSQFLIFLLMLSSCSVGPDYVPPCISAPDSWKNPSSECQQCYDSDELIYLENWWEIFDDEKLNALELEAVANNRDLFVAYERIMEARALMKIAMADFYPQLTLDPQYSVTEQLIEIFGPTKSFVRAHQLLYLIPLNLSYEVDLWGRIQDRYDSVQYSWEAQIYDYYNIMLSLTSNLAVAYFQLRAADRELDLLQSTLKTRRKAFEINETRYEEKVTFYADVTLAGEEISTVEAQYYNVLRQRMLLEDQIAVLLGAIPSEFCLDHIPLPIEASPPCIPAGIPSEILARRPDVAEAERLVRSKHALVKEAFSRFFPSLTLTAAGGFESPILKLFLQRISRYWMLGASSNQMVFDGGRLDGNYERQVAQFREASGTYQQQVLVAFQEVEDALNNIENYSKQFEQAQISVQWAQKSYQLYLDRYTYGLTYYIDVVNTERDLLNFQVTANQLHGYQYVSTIQLIRALGGGWSYDCGTRF